MIEIDTSEEEENIDLIEKYAESLGLVDLEIVYATLTVSLHSAAKLVAKQPESRDDVIHGITMILSEWGNVIGLSVLTEKDSETQS